MCVSFVCEFFVCSVDNWNRKFHIFFNAFFLDGKEKESFYDLLLCCPWSMESISSCLCYLYFTYFELMDFASPEYEPLANILEIFVHLTINLICDYVIWSEFLVIFNFLSMMQNFCILIPFYLFCDFCSSFLLYVLCLFLCYFNFNF